MNLQIDPLGDQLTTHPIQIGWEITIDRYPNSQFRCIDQPDRQIGNGSDPTRTQTWSDGLEWLLTLSKMHKQKLELTGLAKRPKIRGLSGICLGLPFQEWQGRVSRYLWIHTNPFLQSNPGLLSG